MTRPFAPTVLAAALALGGLAACSDNTPSAPGLDPATTTNTATESPTAQATQEPMPLDPYRAVIDGTAAFELEKWVTDHNRLHELLAECMAEKGFEFFPEVMSLDEMKEAADASDPNYPRKGTLKFAERYGFGFYHDPFQEAAEDEPDPGLDPRTEAELAYLDALSQSELAAYHEALEGDHEAMWTTDADGESVFVYDWTKAGCMGWAEHTVFGDQVAAQSDPAFLELVEAVEAAVPTRENDDDAAALSQEWSACMSASGYQFPDRETAVLELGREFEDTMFAPKTNDGSRPPWKSTPEEFEAFFVERERPMAIADATCAESIDYDARFREITVAFEQRFVDEHRAELDALMLQHG